MNSTETSPRRTRLLLINPRFPESFWSFSWAVREIVPGKRAINPPLGLATLAALCPPDWEVTLCDENVEPVPLAPDADIVGVCGMAVQHPRQRELLEYYRRHGYYVVAGGSYASLCPERFEGIADATVAGEAEYIWPRFCADFKAGAPRTLYQEQGVVALEDSPTPRFELLDLDRYTTASLQFSRGCPYRCDFCDIIVMFGRRPRCKTLEQVERELDALRAQGVRNVFFVDDNLIGHKAKAKALLRHLRDYQTRHDYRFEFGTEASLNLAEDEELLTLFREAGFCWVFLGIETPDPQSLQEAQKTQNLRGDLLEALRTLYRNGIDVLGGFIVGFDNDTVDIFDTQYRFITAGGIQVAMVGLLTALPRTPLYARLEHEGRLRHDVPHGDNTKARTNVVPRSMSYEAMIDGYRSLYRRLTDTAAITRRIRNKTAHFRAPDRAPAYPWRESLRMLVRVTGRGILPGGPRRTGQFLRTLVTARPSLWPLVVTEWVRGLAMRDYVRRHLTTEAPRADRLIQRLLDFARRAYADHIRRGAVSIGVEGDVSGPRVVLDLKGQIEARFFSGVARRLEKVLKHSAATLTLRIEDLRACQRPQLERLLRRLARYGDRVVIQVGDGLRPLLGIDSSVFHLALDTDRAAPP